MMKPLQYTVEGFNQEIGSLTIQLRHAQKEYAEVEAAKEQLAKEKSELLLSVDKLIKENIVLTAENAELREALGKTATASA